MRYCAGMMLALMLTSISGCAPIIKNGATTIEEVKIPHDLITSNNAVNASQDHWKSDGWWQVFKNDQLNDLLKLALKGNPGVAEANSRLRIAQAEILQTSAVQYPRVDGAAAITNVHYSSNGDHGIYNGETNTIGVVDPLIINYHLDFWGRDKEAIASTKANAAIFQARLKQSEVVLRQSVIKTYFALKIAEELVMTQLQIVELAKEIEAIKNNALQAGLQPTAYILPPRLYIYESKASLAVIKQKKNALQYALADLLGNDPGHAIALAPGKLAIPEQLPIPQNINLALISRRPDIQAALWNIRYAFHLEKAAQKEYYPNINLRALLGLNSLGLASLFKAGSLTYAAGPVLSLPIFDHGALKGKFDASAAAYDAAVFAYNQAILNAAKEVATNLANLENTKSELEAQSFTLEDRAAIADVAIAEYSSGISDKLPYLEAQIGQKNAYRQYLQAQLKWLYAITDMATALDGDLQETVNADKS